MVFRPCHAPRPVGDRRAQPVGLRRHHDQQHVEAVLVGGSEARVEASPRIPRHRVVHREARARPADSRTPVAARASQAPDEPVRWQHGQRLRRGFEEQHEQVIECRVLAARRSRHAPLVPIPECRLVAMVPVGDRHRSRAGQGNELCDVLARVALGLGDPQPMPDVVCVAEVDGGRSAAIVARIAALAGHLLFSACCRCHTWRSRHGTTGRLVIIISKSGESPEIKVLVPLIKNFGNTLIAMVGNTASYLAKQSNYFKYHCRTGSLPKQPGAYHKYNGATGNG